jgi:hypothetical protein
MKKFFRFTVPDESSVLNFTHLVLWLQTVSVSGDGLAKAGKSTATTYVDDCRVAAAMAAETSAKMLSLTVIQLSGWNIQLAKTLLEPTQQ